jgi:hypothetical protein
MQKAWKYRGRAVSVGEIGFIRELIATHPEAGRCALSRRLCEAWNWKQANGALCDQICRGLLLKLERAGEIQLPPVRFRPARNPLAERRPPELVVADERPVRGPLSGLLPLDIQLVRRSADEPLFNSLIEQYHYLGYEQPVGEHLKFLVKVGGQAIACLAWSSAPRHLGARDRFIGWDLEARRRNIRLIAYNSRYLILPWVEQVPHLASHILGRMARRVRRDWERMYAHPIYLLETFVDPERFRGTCYRAANWIVVGQTTGRGKDCQSWKPNRSIKQILVLPLHRRFRQLLSQ